MKNVYACDSELRASEPRNTTYKMRWNPRRRRRASWSPGGVRSVESTQPEVTSTVLVVSGSAASQGGTSSITDVLVNSSVDLSMRVEDMVQTNVPVPSNVGVQPSNSGTVGLLCFNQSKARDVEKLTDLVLTSTAFPGKPCKDLVRGHVRTSLDLTEAYSFALGTGVAADLESYAMA